MNLGPCGKQGRVEPEKFGETEWRQSDQGPGVTLENHRARCRRTVGRMESSGYPGVWWRAWQKWHMEKESWQLNVTVTRSGGWNHSKPASTVRGPKQQIRANLTHPKESFFATVNLKLKGMHDALGFQLFMDLPGKAPNSDVPHFFSKWKSLQIDCI